MELLQNAHDALAKPAPVDPRRISFVLNKSPEPALLVGNTGRPFHHKDFKGLCQLAQSPKDPNESVGNKGLGFRSVLEVSTRPEIWSTAPAGSDMCFSFRFDPAVIDEVQAVAHDLVRHGLDVRSPFDTDRALVDWSHEQLEQFRRAVKDSKSDLAEEVKHLSPYQLALLAGAIPSDVQRLLDIGHVTVIRLPLDNGEDAIQSVEKQLHDLRNARSVVFLDHLAELAIEVEGDQRRLMRIEGARTHVAGRKGISQRRLRVESDDAGQHHFRLWSRTIGGDRDPSGAEHIRSAVAHLPNRWPEVRQATVGLAVEDAPEQAEGVFVIFLPTEKATGTGSLVNAPFYGSLDRRDIDFNERYNDLILESALDLSLDVVCELAEGPLEAWRARAVLDIVAPVTSVDSDPWHLSSKINGRAEERGSPLNDQVIILCDDGWRTPKEARLMPKVTRTDPIGVDRWRQYAEFSIVSGVLDGRKAAAARLLGDSANPRQREWIRTVERMARQRHQGYLAFTWDDFMRSALEVLPDGLTSKPWSAYKDPLRDALFLPTSDGRLIAASGTTRLFFRPVQGDDVEDIVQSVPPALQSRLAFLHADVQTHEGQARNNTDVQKFLDGRFAKTYRSEDLLRDVVIPALPSLPVAHESPEAAVCAEVLEWAHRLLGGESPDTLLRHLQQLPVCCHGGWLPAGRAVFGPGWPDRHGDDVATLSEELAERTALQSSVLLSPSDCRWRIDVGGWAGFFTCIGVMEGLRLRPDQIRFSMDEYYSELAETPPSSTPDAAWASWCNSVREQMDPPYVSRHEYEVTRIQLLPEVHHLAELTQAGRRALANLLCCSIGRWDAGWESVTVSKVAGQRWRTDVTSPLSHWLRTTAWLSDRDESARLLSRRWLVPESLLRGQAERYAHLDPLPLGLAKQLGEEPVLRERLTMLGLNEYPTDSDETGPALLDALAQAWIEGRVPSGRFDIFLGQVRDAWRHLDLDIGFPNTFLVRSGPRSFLTCELEGMAGVFLPDNRSRARALRDHGKHILEMEVQDATRVANALVSTSRVSRASDLEEEYTIDGARWRPTTAEAVPLDASKYSWLPVVALSVAAHGGTNPAGATTTAWMNAAERIRRTRVVECNEIRTKVVQENKVVAESEPLSQWLPGDVLAVRQDLESHGDLAFAVQSMVNRQDILKDLRLVLGSLPPEDVTQEEIEAALARAEIDAPAFADIRQRWLGDISSVADRIRPVLTLLGVSELGFEEATTDADRLAEWLSANVRDWHASDLLSAAQRSHDDRAMGLAAWRELGDVAQLPAWNAALEKLGARHELVENQEVSEQVQLHLEAATPLLQAFARHVAIAEDEPALFHRIEGVARAFRDDPGWSTRWWEVPFIAILGALIADYEVLTEVTPYVKLIEGLETVERLRERFDEEGIEVVNPYEVAAKNERRLEEVLSEVQVLHQAWIESTGTSEGARLMPAVLPLDETAYVSGWPEHKLLAMAVQRLGDGAFKDACAECLTLDAVRRHLDLTPQAIEKRRLALVARQHEEIRQRRTHDVAGQPFELGTSYRDLFDRLSDLAPQMGQHASKDEFSVRADLRKGSGGGSGATRNSRRRPSAEFTELVGVVGEMWAYQYLRSNFGEKVVTRECWVSEIRRSVLPSVEGEPNDISDGHGFDFRFNYRRTKWHVEVKATAGEDLQFDVGVTEIEAATRLARRGGKWRILRVRNALSEKPEFDWLPNPFEDEFKGYFRLHRGGMRVSYSRR